MIVSLFGEEVIDNRNWRSIQNYLQDLTLSFIVTEEAFSKSDKDVLSVDDHRKLRAVPSHETSFLVSTMHIAKFSILTFVLKFTYWQANSRWTKLIIHWHLVMGLCSLSSCCEPVKLQFWLEAGKLNGISEVQYTLGSQTPKIFFFLQGKCWLAWKSSACFFLGDNSSWLWVLFLCWYFLKQDQCEKEWSQNIFDLYELGKTLKIMKRILLTTQTFFLTGWFVFSISSFRVQDPLLLREGRNLWLVTEF